MTDTPTEEAIEHMVALVREHAAQGEPATRAALLAAGHDARTVDMALAKVYGLRLDGSPVTTTSPTTRVGCVTVVVLFANAAALISLITVFSMLVSLFSESDSAAVIAYAIPIIGVLAADGGAMTYYRGRNRAFARGIAWGLGITAGIIVLLLVLLLALITFISTLDFQ